MDDGKEEEIWNIYDIFTSDSGTSAFPPDVIAQRIKSVANFEGDIRLYYNRVVKSSDHWYTLHNGSRAITKPDPYFFLVGLSFTTKHKNAKLHVTAVQS